MVVLQYIPGIDREDGGTSSYMRTLCASLGKCVELHVCTHRSGNMLELSNASVHFISGDLKRLFRVRNEWNALLDDVKPDVVHVNCCWLPLCALVQFWSQKRGIKVVLSPHGMLEPWILQRNYYSRKLPALLLYQRRAIKNADVIHATAESEKENLLKLGYNRNVAVVPNCVDLSEIDVKTDWSKKNRVLFLSRVHEKKGIEFLIDAVAELRKNNEFAEVKYVVAGEGEASYIEELNSRIKLHGLQDVISLVGGLYGDAKADAFRNSDVFVLPTYSENFGIAVAEALAYGTPVITTTGTPWKLLEDEKCGCWIELGTENLVNALRKMLSLNEDELREYGENGRKMIEREFSSESVCSKFLELYKNLLYE